MESDSTCLGRAKSLDAQRKLRLFGLGYGNRTLAGSAELLAIEKATATGPLKACGFELDAAFDAEKVCRNEETPRDALRSPAPGTTGIGTRLAHTPPQPT